jgi:hypothetical protein
LQFGGHDNHHFDNIYAYAGMAVHVCATLSGHEDYFYNNKAVLTGTNVGTVECSSNATVMHDNQYFTPTGGITECGGTLAKHQKSGGDANSTVAKMPTDAAIIGWAKEKLGM